MGASSSSSTNPVWIYLAKDTDGKWWWLQFTNEPTSGDTFIVYNNESFNATAFISKKRHPPEYYSNEIKAKLLDLNPPPTTSAPAPKQKRTRQVEEIKPPPPRGMPWYTLDVDEELVRQFVKSFDLPTISITIEVMNGKDKEPIAVIRNTYKKEKPLYEIVKNAKWEIIEFKLGRDKIPDDARIMDVNIFDEAFDNRVIKCKVKTNVVKVNTNLEGSPNDYVLEVKKSMPLEPQFRKRLNIDKKYDITLELDDEVITDGNQLEDDYHVVVKIQEKVISLMYYVFRNVEDYFVPQNANLQQGVALLIDNLPRGTVPTGNEMKEKIIKALGSRAAKEYCKIYEIPGADHYICTLMEPQVKVIVHIYENEAPNAQLKRVVEKYFDWNAPFADVQKSLQTKDVIRAIKGLEADTSGVALAGLLFRFEYAQPGGLNIGNNTFHGSTTVPLQSKKFRSGDIIRAYPL